MIPQDKIGKIKRFALHLDWDVAFEGKGKGSRHLFRISAIALELAKREGGRKDIIEAAAWLHNVGLIHGNKNHDMTGKKIAEEFLKSIGVSFIDSEQILHCIEAHEGNVRAISKEAKVVHDADVIDKMGPLGVIRQTWKLANSGVPTEKLCKMLPPYMERRRQNVYTKTAKAAADTLALELDSFFTVLETQLDGSAQLSMVRE